MTTIPMMIIAVIIVMMALVAESPHVRSKRTGPIPSELVAVDTNSSSTTATNQTKLDGGRGLVFVFDVLVVGVSSTNVK